MCQVDFFPDSQAKADDAPMTLRQFLRRGLKSRDKFHQSSSLFSLISRHIIPGPSLDLAIIRNSAKRQKRRDHGAKQSYRESK
jgi:hypothetical protein